MLCRDTGNVTSFPRSMGWPAGHVGSGIDSDNLIPGSGRGSAQRDPTKPCEWPTSPSEPTGPISKPRAGSWRPRGSWSHTRTMISATRSTFPIRMVIGWRSRPMNQVEDRGSFSERPLPVVQPAWWGNERPKRDKRPE